MSGKIDSFKLEHFYKANVSKPAELFIEVDNLRIQKSIEINARKHLSNWSPNSRNESRHHHNTSINSGGGGGGGGSASGSSSSTGVGSANSNLNTSVTSDHNDSSLTADELNQNYYDRKLTILKRVNFYDENNRPLFLVARITFKIGSNQLINVLDASSSSWAYKPCPIVIKISSIYCFFNLTGLPLIFRQYNCDESAGQLEEHEVACSNQPLLFSFNEVGLHLFRVYT